MIVTDADVDVTNLDELIYAALTRSDPAEDFDLIRGGKAQKSDPRLPPWHRETGNLVNSRMIIDACRPYDRLETFPLVARTSQERAEKLRTDWSQLFTADGKVKKGVKRVLKS